MKCNIEVLNKRTIRYGFETDSYICNLFWGHADRAERKRIGQKLVPVMNGALAAIDNDSPQQLAKALAVGKSKFPGQDWSGLFASAVSEEAYRCALWLLKDGCSHEFICGHVNLPQGHFLRDAPPEMILAFKFEADPDETKRRLIVEIIDELIRRGVDMNRIVQYQLSGGIRLGVPKTKLDAAGAWLPVQSVIDHRELIRVVPPTPEIRARVQRI